LAGLSITYALQLTGQLNWLVRMSTEVETNLISVERCTQYIRLEVENPPILEFRPPLTWPSQGAISIQNLCLRYRKGLPLVLNGINCHIKPKEKIGIVGRTGSGKSSLMLALVRIVEPEMGSIRIDDLDIQNIGLDDLRSKLALIPQDPTLFTGTIKSNLDPFCEHSDEEIWHALEATSIADQVKQMNSGLESPVSEFGENLSVGTRQLMCLARAILTDSKILVMDEATASVDFETDTLIQKTIRREFANVTVLTIAHRVNTILDSDRVMVLSDGQITEFDSPSMLLKNDQSAFFSLVKEAGVKEGVIL